MKKIISIIFGITATIVTSCNFFDSFEIDKNEYDEVTKENNKIGILYDSLYSHELRRIQQHWYSGYKDSAYVRFEKLPTLIQKIETYARYGSGNDSKSNLLEVRITFKNGDVANELYTGVRVLTSMIAPQLLLKLEFENGKVFKSYSNGVELNGSPNDITNDLLLVLETLSNYDAKKNHSDYYDPPKTDEDLKKEWDNIK